MSSLHIITLIALLAQLNTITQGSDDACSEDQLNQIKDYSLPDNDIDIEICLNSTDSEYTWTKVCAEGWTNTHAKLACRQLGLPYTAAVPTNSTNGVSTNCIKLPGCRGTEANLTECTLGNLVPETNMGTTAGVNCRCSNGQVQLWSTTGNQQEGIVQLCEDDKWKVSCKAGWDIADANVVCRQLGYLDKGATTNSERETNYDFDNFVRNPKCSGTEISLAECSLTTATGCTNLATVNCLPANCKEKEIRLVNGSTQREGRVEVCIDQRWGTICTNNQQELELAEGVCTKLGFPSEQAAVASHFGEGTAPIYTCTRNENMTLDCVDTSNVNCDHSMDLGVVCKSHQEITQQQCNMPTSSTTSPSVSTDTGQICGNTNGALGAIIGILLALLVAIVTGWLCMCIIYKRRNTTYKISKSNHDNIDIGDLSSPHRQLDNPIYDGTITEPHPPASYSSQGPAYEVVQANEGAGHTYDVINTDKRQRAKDKKMQRPETKNVRESSTNLLPDNNHNTQDDAHNMEGEDDHLYHVLEEAGPAGSGGQDSNPLEYEVPAPRAAHRGASKEEGEYSHLKH